MTDVAPHLLLKWFVLPLLHMLRWDGPQLLEALWERWAQLWLALGSTEKQHKALWLHNLSSLWLGKGCIYPSNIFSKVLLKAHLWHPEKGCERAWPWVGAPHIFSAHHLFLPAVFLWDPEYISYINYTLYKLYKVGIKSNTANKL